jgi:hypothetical protein
LQSLYFVNYSYYFFGSSGGAPSGGGPPGAASPGAGAGSVGATVCSSAGFGVSAFLQLTIKVNVVANTKESTIIRIFFIEESPPSF